MEEITVSFSPRVSEVLSQLTESPQQTIARLMHEKEELLNELSYEKERREAAESRAEQLLAQIETLSAKKTKKPKEVKEYSDFKSDGKRKAHAAESIRSYEDFVAIQKYFEDRNRVRDWAMWTIGVSLGLRVSDLLSLKVSSILEADGKTFKKRIVLNEQKTGKINSCLTTEAVIKAATVYFNSLSWEMKLDSYLFPSTKTGGKMYEEYGWKIISDAGKALKMPFNIGSHTMRKSFANIAACVDKSSVDMNSITKIQGLLNHSDQRVTMRYLGTYQDMFDKARVAVSDFVLGKTNVHELIAGNNYTIDDIMAKLEKLTEKDNQGVSDENCKQKFE